MKYWLSHLPLEVWVDVFCYPWRSREEIGQIVDKFKNHKFAEYLQFYLHDWGKHKLKNLYFDEDGIRKFVSTSYCWGKLVKIDIPQTPMPYNIKSFGNIRISYFDQQAVSFLRQIRPLLVVADIKLELRWNITSNLNNLRVILDNMLPLLDGINLLRCYVRVLPTVGQCFGNKLGKINMIETVNIGKLNETEKQATVDFLMHWLRLPQQEGNNGPRFCDMGLFKEDNVGFFEQISAEIRQEFLASKDPYTFSLGVSYYLSQKQFVEFHLQNNIGEELHCIAESNFRSIQITRHPANCSTEMQEWIKEKRKEVYKGHIIIENSTVGLIDGIDAPESGDWGG